MRYTVIVVLCLLLAACATGPVSAPLAAGGAAMVAVFDQLLAGGVVDPLQHQTLVQSVQALDGAVKAAQSNSVTPETAATAAGGLTAAILGGIRLWRGPSTKATKPA